MTSPLAILMARNLLKTAERRATALPDASFGDPTWLILLNLFVEQGRHVSLSITDTCTLPNIPVTTALRHTRHLIDDGKLLAERDPNDQRRTWVRLAPQTAAGLQAVLDRMAADVLAGAKRLEAAQA